MGILAAMMRMRQAVQGLPVEEMSAHLACRGLACFERGRGLNSASTEPNGPLGAQACCS